jgi:hypothetical protein
VKEAGRFVLSQSKGCAFVLMVLLGYNQGESPSTAALMMSPVRENHTSGYFDKSSTGPCGG